LKKEDSDFTKSTGRKRWDWTWWNEKKNIIIGGAQNTLIVVILFLAWASSIVIMVFTFMQFSHQTQTSLGSSLVIPDSNNDPCSVVKYRPLRFRFLDDDEFIYCAWNGKNQALRLMWCLLAIFIPIFCIWSLRTGRRWAIWVFAFMCLAVAGVFFYSMAIDSNDVRLSSGWCNGDPPLEGITLNPPDIVCDYWPYITICLLDTASLLLWISVAIVSIWHVRKNMNKSIFTIVK